MCDRERARLVSQPDHPIVELKINQRVSFFYPKRITREKIDECV